MVISDEQLVALIKEGKYLSDSNLVKAVNNYKEKGISFYQSLIDLDLISDQNLGKLIADFIKIPFIELSKISIPKEVLKIIPEEVAARKLIIAFDLDDTGLKVAMADPTNQTLIHNLTVKAGKPIVVYFATEKDLKNNLVLYREELQKSFDKLLTERFSKENKLQAAEFPIKETVDLLIEYAYSERASDIHIEPKNEIVLVRFRIDGILRDVLKGPKQLHEQIITRLKVMARLQTDEHASAQDGKIQVKLPEEELDIRISITPIVEGEKAVLRLLSSKSRQFGLSDLGMSAADLAKVEHAFTKPYGMIFSTGPTGSGKTTSMYAILKILNTREKNIATIEDPVEYEIEGINQIQVNDKTNLTFAAGLRSILRQDPDIIFVGEVRDEDTAGIAVNSAMTGHLVLSTLHTNDAATALPRLIDLKVEPFLIASTVNVIVAQRLVRKICEKCRVSTTFTKDELSKHFSGTMVEKLVKGKNDLRVYQGKGCSVCHNSGYVGRIGVFEVLVVSEAIRALISQKANSSIIEAKAVEEGMTTLFDDCIAKVLEGITTIEELMRAIKE